MGIEKRVYIKYLNDDGQSKSGYFWLIDISNNLVTFRTDQNIIRIPSQRILKIKEEVGGSI